MKAEAEITQDQGLEAALAVLAEPIGRDIAQLQSAAVRVNATIEEEQAVLAELEADYSRDSLDLLGRGDAAGATALAQAVMEKRERVKQLGTAIQEANRRQLQAQHEAEVVKAREKIAQAKPLMAEREKIARQVEDALKVAGEGWAKLEALGYQIQHHLPTDRPFMMDMLDQGDIERRVENALRQAAGKHIDGPFGVASACRSGHGQLEAAHMPRGSQPTHTYRLRGDGRFEPVEKKEKGGKHV